MSVIPQSRIPVAVLGATGTVGQRFIELLQGHPWFELVALAASDRHGGKTYREATPWRLGGKMPVAVADLPLRSCTPEALPEARIVFSALPGEVAGEIELAFAQAGVAVFSNAKNYRMTADVPLLIPEVNANHIAAIVEQRRRRGWSTGCIVTNANCSATPLVMALKPLQLAFGVRKALITTFQAISGAGYPGIPSFDILDNVIPYIGGEEEKLERETRKMLGAWEEGRGFIDAPLAVSAHCNRVATRDGHLGCVSLELERTVAPEEIIAAWESYVPEPQQLKLPSAPAEALAYNPAPDRPQTLLDRDAGAGMTVTIGRLRECPILGYKFVLLGHNTIRGAAGGSILNAELCVAKGLVA